MDKRSVHEVSGNQRRLFQIALGCSMSPWTMNIGSGSYEGGCEGCSDIPPSTPGIRIKYSGPFGLAKYHQQLCHLKTQQCSLSSLATNRTRLSPVLVTIQAQDIDPGSYSAFLPASFTATCTTAKIYVMPLTHEDVQSILFLCIYAHVVQEHNELTTSPALLP